MPYTIHASEGPISSCFLTDVRNLEKANKRPVIVPCRKIPARVTSTETSRSAQRFPDVEGVLTLSQFPSEQNLPLIALSVSKHTDAGVLALLMRQ
jgi:hypothetical protein